MADDLDRMLARLSQEAGPRAPDGFETRVLAGVAARREALRAGRALGPAQFAAVGLALAVGVTAGGLAGVRTVAGSHGFETFSTATHLAPSTLLEGDG